MRGKVAALFLAGMLASDDAALGEPQVEEVLRAVVRIRARIPQDARTAETLGVEREGSGLVMDGQGHVLTIGYLILEAEAIEVLGSDERPVKGRFVGYDQETGLGLLRAEEPLDVRPMKVGSAAAIGQGDPVLMAGHGGMESVQGARVIARREFAGYWEYLLEDAILTSPPHPGFGGAALLDRDGALVGIGGFLTTVAVQGLGAIPANVSIPADVLPGVLEALKASGRSRNPPRPWLGINVEEARGRVFVTRVTGQGPAWKAGLQVDDLILAVSGAAVQGLADLYRKLWALGSAGVHVPLTLLRGMKVLEITVPSEDRHAFYIRAPGKAL
jgi:S1-C subfamily serine protease